MAGAAATLTAGAGAATATGAAATLTAAYDTAGAAAYDTAGAAAYVTAGAAATLIAGAAANRIAGAAKSHQKFHIVAVGLDNKLKFFACHSSHNLTLCQVKIDESCDVCCEDERRPHVTILQYCIPQRVTM
uniref:Uncharacterized protein n=1 Tax=Glossina brevipalpis TaxID=37001 RepID=A0A1A9WIU6_9MUSC